MEIEIRKTANAYCRECGKRPINEMIILRLLYNLNIYLCQNCAKNLQLQLKDLPTTSTILPPNKRKKIEDGDLSNI